jgi:thiol:disulfide interchange protein
MFMIFRKESVVMRRQWLWLSMVLFLIGMSAGQPNPIIDSAFTVSPVRAGGRIGLAVQCQKAEDLHFYANKETAPGGFALKVEATAKGVSFGPAEFPKHSMFFDKAFQKDIEVFVGPFTIFVPIEAPRKTGSAEVTVKVSGIACTSKLCLPPFENARPVQLDFAAAASWPTIQLESGIQSPVPSPQIPSGTVPAPPSSRVSILARVGPQGFSAPVAMALALLAGLSINIMPCVLPILPLIVMRLVEQSRQSPRRRIGLGLAFCGGIVLFFIVFAALAAGIKLTTGVAVDWGDHLRYPAVATALFLLIVIMGLFLLDVFSIRLPGSISGSQGSGQGIAGSVGMGFFAAILSTPCSGAYFGMVLIWAQTQPWAVGMAAIVMMGVGMALPYGILVSFPALLQKVPRPGEWMDLFRKAMAFVLFYLAVKLALPALSGERLLNVIKYAVVLSFALWMWGGWVSFSTPAGKKWLIRGLAILLAVASGFWLLPSEPAATGTKIDWQDYDPVVVNRSVAEKKPVLIKFTADWCTNCKVVERTVFHDSEVAGMLAKKGVVAMIGDTTQKQYRATIDLHEIYKIPGTVPTTIILTPDGTQHQLLGIFDKQELLQILQPLPEGNK